MAKANVNTTGEWIAFQRVGNIGTDKLWRRIEILQVKDRDADKTRARLERFYESTLEIYDVDEIDIPDWAEPLEKWKGADVSEQVGCYLCFLSEWSDWEDVLMRDIRSFDSLNVRELEKEKVLMKLCLFPGDREMGFEMLRRVMVGRRKFFIWSGYGDRKKGVRGIKEDHIVSRVLLDTLLRKYSSRSMRMKGRYKIMRYHIEELRSIEDNAISQSLRRNKGLKKIFESGKDAFVEKRRRDDEGVVDKFIEFLKKQFKVG